MKTWLLRILFVLIAVVALLAAAAAWFIATFDANKYKSVAIDWVQAHKNRTLAIDGPIRLSVFPRLEVQLSKVSLSEHGRSDRFAAVDEAALAVQVLPLLHRQVVVDRISARGISVVITRDAKGARNIDDLIAPQGNAAAAAPAAPASGANAAPRFDVSRIELKDVKASINDAMVPLRGDVVLASLVTGRVADKIETPVDLQVQFALQAPAVRGTLSGSARVRPDLATGSVQASAAQLRYTGDVPGVSGLDVTLKGAVAYDGQGGAVRAAPLDIAAGATLGVIKLAPSSTVRADVLEFDPAHQRIVLTKLHVNLAAGQAKDTYAMELDWPNLAVSGTNSLQGSALSGSIAVNGSQSLNGRFQSGPPTGNFDQLRIPGLALSLEGKSGARAVTGKLTTDVVLRAAQSAASFDKLVLQATLNEPGLPPLALGVQGSLGGTRQEAQWNLSGKLNTNQFSTEGKAQLADKVPAFQLQARFDALDVNKVLGNPPPKADSQAPAPPASPDTPVDLSALQHLRGQVALRAGSLTLRQYQVRNAILDAALDGGVLRITRLQGDAWQGHIDASGFADARASTIGVKLAASDVNINALLKDVAGKDLLEGTGRVNADVQTSGKTVGEMRSRLAGSGGLQLRNGAVKGINLARSLRRAKAALGGGGQDDVTQANTTEKTDFTELSATFRIADGIARSNDLEAKSPFLRLGGEGSADIGRGRIDYTARATVAATSKGQEGAELADLRGVTVPVQLSGPFDAIGWKIQWSAIASSLIKSRAQEQLKDKLAEKLGIKPNAAAGAASAAAPADAAAQAKEKLKNKLKGLLK